MKRQFLLLSFIIFCLSCFAQENTALFFGNPSGASTDLQQSENYLMEKEQFSLSYNSSWLIPNWVSWHLAQSDFGETGRGNDFRADGELPDSFYAVKKTDYQYSQYGFDRGHVCPSADRTASSKDNSQTFLMTNMIPQSPACNRDVWKQLEDFERTFVKQGYEAYIIAGPYGEGGTSLKGSFSRIPLANGKNILVPSFCWKIILLLPEGDDDLSRVNEETLVIAVLIPNNQECGSAESWKEFVTSIDYIEEITGFDFFNRLPDEIENLLEKKVYKND